MSDPSINDIVKGEYRKSTAVERDWWNRARADKRYSILAGKNLDTGFTNETASENAYQQDYTAKYNQLVKTNYDSLPVPIQDILTESLIEQGELPDPSDFNGIGQEFVANPDDDLEKEIFIECDRCDESFMDDEDFATHKDITHGDKLEDSTEAEDGWLDSMDPDASREELAEARKIITEEDQGVLSRSVYFNGDKLPKATVTEPDLPKGKVGYNDNPNEGLYDTKIFKQGSSADRGGGKVTEAEVPTSMSEEDRARLELRNQDAEPWDDEKHGEPVYSEDQIINEADNYPQKDGGTEDEWKDTLDDLKNNFEGHENDVEYEEDGISDISAVPESADDDPAKSLGEVDFAPEKIDYVYPTSKVKAVEVEETNDFLEDYTDGDIETDADAVESQIIDRKLRGYGADSIARELVMQYGVSHEDAVAKTYSIEVSVNDKVANTFFGKRFNECNEAEKGELRLYGGSD